jgi:MFS family permease
MTRAAGGRFYGWRVVGAAFVMAVFGWGLGFYGPPVYLHAVREARHWPLALVSTAVTAHFVVGALVVANLPALHRRFGIPAVTKAGALCSGLGVVGWAMAPAPAWLFAATLLSGAGWAATSGAAVNAIVSPWFVRERPAALSTAYNGASVGGVIFSPLWVAAIAALGFPAAAAAIGLVTVVVIWALADLLLSRTPEQMGLRPDGDAADGAAAAAAPLSSAVPRPGSSLWRDPKFVTLAACMAIGLFAQIGMIAHLFSLLVPALGAHGAGLGMGLATGMAIAGRTLVGWLMPAGSDRRLVACASYAVQIVGCVAFVSAGGTSVPLLLVGIVLFGFGIGNATSLPPLIAQTEFAKDDVPRVVALIVATAQGTFAFAPAVFGLIRKFSMDDVSGAAPAMFIAAALLKAIAITALLIGRRAPDA